MSNFYYLYKYGTNAQELPGTAPHTSLDGSQNIWDNNFMGAMLNYNRIDLGSVGFLFENDTTTETDTFSSFFDTYKTIVGSDFMSYTNKYSNTYQMAMGDMMNSQKGGASTFANNLSTSPTDFYYRLTKDGSPYRYTENGTGVALVDTALDTDAVANWDDLDLAYQTYFDYKMAQFDQMPDVATKFTAVKSAVDLSTLGINYAALTAGKTTVEEKQAVYTNLVTQITEEMDAIKGSTISEADRIAMEKVLAEKQAALKAIDDALLGYAEPGLSTGGGSLTTYEARYDFDTNSPAASAIEAFVIMNHNQWAGGSNSRLETYYAGYNDLDHDGNFDNPAEIPAPNPPSLQPVSHGGYSYIVGDLYFADSAAYQIYYNWQYGIGSYDSVSYYELTNTTVTSTYNTSTYQYTYDYDYDFQLHQLSPNPASYAPATAKLQNATTGLYKYFQTTATDEGIVGDDLFYTDQGSALNAFKVALSTATDGFTGLTAGQNSGYDRTNSVFRDYLNNAIVNDIGASNAVRTISTQTIDDRTTTDISLREQDKSYLQSSATFTMDTADLTNIRKQINDWLGNDHENDYGIWPLPDSLNDKPGNAHPGQLADSAIAALKLLETPESIARNDNSNRTYSLNTKGETFQDAFEFFIFNAMVTAGDDGVLNTGDDVAANPNFDGISLDNDNSWSGKHLVNHHSDGHTMYMIMKNLNASVGGSITDALNVEYEGGMQIRLLKPALEGGEYSENAKDCLVYDLADYLIKDNAFDVKTTSEITRVTGDQAKEDVAVYLAELTSAIMEQYWIENFNKEDAEPITDYFLREFRSYLNPTAVSGKVIVNAHDRLGGTLGVELNFDENPDVINIVDRILASQSFAQIYSKMEDRSRAEMELFEASAALDVVQNINTQEYLYRLNMLAALEIDAYANKANLGGDAAVKTIFDKVTRHLVELGPGADKNPWWDEYFPWFKGFYGNLPEGATPDDMFDENGNIKASMISKNGVLIDPYIVNINGVDYVMGQDDNKDGKINGAKEVLGINDTIATSFASLKGLDLNADGVVSQEELKEKNIIFEAMNVTDRLNGAQIKSDFIKSIELASMQDADGTNGVYGTFEVQLANGKKAGGIQTFETQEYFNNLFGTFVDMSFLTQTKEEKTEVKAEAKEIKKEEVIAKVEAKKAETVENKFDFKSIQAKQFKFFSYLENLDKNEEVSEEVIEVAPEKVELPIVDVNKKPVIIVSNKEMTVDALIEDICWKMNIDRITSKQRYDILGSVDATQPADIVIKKIEEQLAKTQFSA